MNANNCAVPVLIASASWFTAQETQASVVLTPENDVVAIGRSGNPYTSESEFLQVINFAWATQSHLKFDLGHLQGLGQATGYRLRLYEVDHGYSPDLKDDVIDLYTGTNDQWVDSTPYAQLPVSQTLLDRLSQPAVGGQNVIGWAEWSFAPSAVAADIADGKLSLVVSNTQQLSSGWNETRYYSSSQQVDPDFRPQLVIEGAVSVVPEPAALSVLVSTSLLAMRRRRTARGC